jgi:2-polyprenyl-3-methyl-5-hydroxy-6-metoxy-1,4-benzoquinol methylase
MERADWLKQMRIKAEALYDQLSPQYWVTFGLYENETHRACLQKFLERVAPGGAVLSAGCGAGRYDGLLLDAGHPVVGIDQSAGMLARARERFPQASYEKMGLQEMAFREAFDGVICIDAMEHVSPEDYPHILHKFQEALKPGGVLYFTMDRADPGELEEAYERARAKGLPVILGEVVDEVDAAYAQVKASDQPVPRALADVAVYHFYPSLDQAREWIDQAGLAIEEEGAGSGYHHFVSRKKKE